MDIPGGKIWSAKRDVKKAGCSFYQTVATSSEAMVGSLLDTTPGTYNAAGRIPTIEDLRLAKSVSQLVRDVMRYKNEV